MGKNDAVNLDPFFRAIIEADHAPVVICDLTHTVLYVNPAAVKRYSYAGGDKLVGSSILDCHKENGRKWILDIVEWFKQGKDNNVVFEGPGTKEDKDVYCVALRDDDGELIGYYEKHEYRSHETGKKFDFCL